MFSISSRLTKLLLPLLISPLLHAEKLPARVQDAQFSVNRGYFEKPFELMISTQTAGATIIYTTDGTQPSRKNGLRSKTGAKLTALVDSSTIVRAIAVKDGLKSTAIGTHSYLFAQDILQQQPNPSWPKEVDQGMDSRITNDPARKDDLLKAFARIPTTSVVVDHDKLLGPDGSYLNPAVKGRASEIGTSIEWIDGIGQKSFQIDCGLRMQGSGSRSQSAKKNFRLRFAKKFGDERLKAQLFNEPGPEVFKNLILKNPTHDSWTVTDYNWRNNARYVNNAWAGETQRLMGHLTPRRRWVHLLLNGTYWGVYELSERPDEHFAASHLKKEAKDFVVFNEADLKSGRREQMDEARKFLVNELTNTPEGFAKLAEYIDLNVFIDYFIANIYAGHVDWPNRNFWLIGEQGEAPQFKFVNWDSEIGFFERWKHPRNQKSSDALGFKQLADSRLLFDTFGAGYWYRQLKEHAEFRLLFADRLNQHLSTGGVLSPAQAALRYRRLLTEIEPLLHLEAARWGDSLSKDLLYHAKSPEWGRLTSSKSWLFSTFFPNRAADLIADFQADGMFPKVLPPKIERSASRRVLKSERKLALSNPNPRGVIVYTTNGKDPREAWTDKIVANAYREPISIKQGQVIKARVISWKKWSALLVFDPAKN